MERHNTVYLLVGPRASGKSSYATQLMKQDPSLTCVSRDEVLTRLFGSVHSDEYSGSTQIVRQIINRLLRMKLRKSNQLRLLFDYWTGSSHERKEIIHSLREMGVDRVVALYFTTHVDMVNEWFWKKPGIAKASEMKHRQGEDLVFYSEGAPTRDYKLFHEYASGINEDGFDEVVRVDPLQELYLL